MKKSFATGAIPFRPVRRDRMRERPRLVVLCDVSESVRYATEFMLEFVYAVKELFENTRSFVFVSGSVKYRACSSEKALRPRLPRRPARW